MRESDGRQDEGWMSPKYAEAREEKEGVNPSWAGGKQDEVAGQCHSHDCQHDP